MRTLRLEGELAERFGSEFTLDIVSPAEGVQALCAMLRGFREAVKNHPVGFHLFVGGESRGEDQLLMPAARSEVIVLAPAIAGSGDTARIIVGAVLVVVGAFTSEYGGSYLVSLGLALMAGGIASKLATKPKTNEATNSNNISGYAFSSGVNTTGQGVGISLAFGRGLSGTHVISAQIISETGVFYASIDGPMAPEDLGANEDGLPDVDAAENTSGDAGDQGSWSYSYGGETFGATAPDGTTIGADTAEALGDAVTSYTSSDTTEDDGPQGPDGGGHGDGDE